MISVINHFIGIFPVSCISMVLESLSFSLNVLFCSCRLVLSNFIFSNSSLNVFIISDIFETSSSICSFDFSNSLISSSFSFIFLYRLYCSVFSRMFSTFPPFLVISYLNLSFFNNILIRPGPCKLATLFMLSFRLFSTSFILF